MSAEEEAKRASQEKIAKLKAVSEAAFARLAEASSGTTENKRQADEAAPKPESKRLAAIEEARKAAKAAEQKRRADEEARLAEIETGIKRRADEAEAVRAAEEKRLAEEKYFADIAKRLADFDAAEQKRQADEAEAAKLAEEKRLADIFETQQRVADAPAASTVQTAEEEPPQFTFGKISLKVPASPVKDSLPNPYKNIALLDDNENEEELEEVSEEVKEEPVKKKFGFGKKSAGARTKMALLQGLRNGSLEKAVEKMEADTSTPVEETDIDERLADNENENENENEEESLCFEQIQVGNVYYLKTADGLQQVFENEDSIWSQEVSGNTTEDTEVTPNSPNNPV